MSDTKKTNTTLWAVSLLSLVTAATSLGICIYLWNSSPKIAYVNNNTILTEYQGVKEGRAEYEQKLKVWNANVDTLQNAFNRDVRSYQQNAAKMTTKERALNEQLLDQKQKEFLNYKQAIENKASEEDTRISASILKQLDSYLLEYGKQNEYDYIIGVTDDGNLLYAREEDDITETVLEEINKTYQGE